MFTLFRHIWTSQLHDHCHSAQIRCIALVFLTDKFSHQIFTTKFLPPNLEFLRQHDTGAEWNPELQLWGDSITTTPPCHNQLIIHRGETKRVLSSLFILIIFVTKLWSRCPVYRDLGGVGEGYLSIHALVKDSQRGTISHGFLTNYNYASTCDHLR